MEVGQEDESCGYRCLRESSDPRRVYGNFRGAEKVEGRDSGVDMKQSLARGYGVLFEA